ncbi:MAG: zinc ribbon domain-containing protein [Candidatus Binatia bacterium]
MPLYEYSCENCHHIFEALVRSTRETIVCPECASLNLERRLSVFSSPGNHGEAAPVGGGCGCTPHTCGCH